MWINESENKKQLSRSSVTQNPQRQQLNWSIIACEISVIIAGNGEANILFPSFDILQPTEIEIIASFLPGTQGREKITRIVKFPIFFSDSPLPYS